MESNTSGNAKGVALQEARDEVAEPYVGMPIYLDDGFFSLLGGRGQCPIADDEDMADVNMSDEDIANEGMPNQGMPNQGMPNQCMPNEGMPNQCMPNEGMPNQCMPNQGMPNQGMPNQGMPNQGMPNQCMPNQGRSNQCMPIQCMPNQGREDMVEGEFSYNLNDCAAGCPLAMAYVPWQSWEKTYEQEVAFRVGTVFPSLDLPFLGGKCK